MVLSAGLISIAAISQIAYTPQTSVQVFSSFEDDEDEEEWEEKRGFGISVNLGVYFASKKSANLYNGACLLEVVDDLQGVRCYTIEERLTLNAQASNSAFNQIINYYNATGMSFPFDMHPFNMRYSPSMMYGLNIMYYFNDLSMLSINANTVRVKAEDQFTLIFQGTGQQQNGQTDTRLFPIWGRETRLNMTMGLRQGWEIMDGSHWYLEAGGSMLSTRVEENVIRVADRNYDLLLGGQNPQQLIQYTPRARTGFGFYAEGGISLTYNERYKIDAGLMISRDRLRIESYDDKVINWSILVRFGI